MTETDAIPRLPTGINGFDQVALGGHPASRPTLVTGATRVALDSLGAVFSRFTEAGIVRQEIRRVAATLRGLGVTSVVKFRGAPHRTGEWLFTIDPREGLIVLPLAFLTPPFAPSSSARVSTGNDGLVGILNNVSRPSPGGPPGAEWPHDQPGDD